MSWLEKNMLHIKRIAHSFYVRHIAKLSLPSMLVIVLIAASGIVVAGYAMYERDINRKYDIARPGQRDDNQVLTVEEEEADTTSVVTPSAAKQKIEYLNREINGLNNTGSFNPDDLSDQNIQLAPPDQPSL